MIARSTQTALPIRRDELAQETAIAPSPLPREATPFVNGGYAPWKRWNGSGRPGPHIGSGPAPVLAISRPRARGATQQTAGGGKPKQEEVVHRPR